VNPLLVQPACTGADCDQTLAYRVLRISSNSPAVNAATGTYSSVLLDFEGQARAGTKDIGADEYSASGIALIGALGDENVGPDAVSYRYTYSIGGVLPVTLINFNTAYKDGKAQLSWQSLNEVGVKQYEVEWSNDGRSYKKIATVAANGSGSYSAEHSGLSTGRNFYRLRILDQDGKSAYSPVRMIVTGNNVEIHLYPNPATHFVMIDFGRSVAMPVDISIINAAGKMVQQQVRKVNGATKVNVGELPSGIYQLQIIQNGILLQSRSFTIVK
ncbi:MAG: T9SS type A sorting domain-containing protein, partial [Chitinophagaceae bacterium]